MPARPLTPALSRREREKEAFPRWRCTAPPRLCHDGHEPHPLWPLLAGAWRSGRPTTPPLLQPWPAAFLRNEARDTFLRSAAPLGSPGNEMIWQRLMATEARAEAAEARLAEPGVPPPQT